MYNVDRLYTEFAMFKMYMFKFSLIIEDYNATYLSAYNWVVEKLVR